MTRTLRVVAIIEALTYLVLIAAVIVYRVFDGPKLTSVMGPIHGTAFLAYFWFVIQAHHEREWAWSRTLPILGAAIIPLGGFYAADRLIEAND
jgi:integral membrane protein